MTDQPDNLDTRQGSADVSADDEKKKWIAQNGDNPNHQERAQDVPQPESDEVKDLQNEAAEREHQAKTGDVSDEEKANRIEQADPQENHGRQVTEKQHGKLK
jgi:hypothetical protein